MKALSTSQVLQENQSDAPDIHTITLTHRALSDVSCLSEFKNLERLDLTFNNLSSIECLKACVNLKWLSVKQNKLRSLKGIEGLVHLTVLNAGSNMLQSMEEVSSLVNLRALILNDNQIVSICRLDQMKELNTLVLSRNPICKIGTSLGKVNSITKLSLSNCKIQAIDSSLKSCTDLRELRLAHNEITTLPGELARNMKIQNLDLGNNLIMRWSDLKILSSLVNLKNFNLVGNPVADKDISTEKIKKLVPSLQTFNARPIHKTAKNVISVDSGDINAKKESKMKKRTRNELSVKGNASDGHEMLNMRSVVDEEETRLSLEPNWETKKSKNAAEKEGIVSVPKKKKKRKGPKGCDAVRLLSPEAEVGSGGPSAWGVD